MGLWFRAGEENLAHGGERSASVGVLDEGNLEKRAGQRAEGLGRKGLSQWRETRNQQDIYSWLKSRTTVSTRGVDAG